MTEKHVYRGWVDENDVGNTCCLAPRTDPIHIDPPSQKDWPNLWQMAWHGKFYGYEESQRELRRLLDYYDGGRVFARVLLDHLDECPVCGCPRITFGVLSEGICECECHEERGGNDRS